MGTPWMSAVIVGAPVSRELRSVVAAAVVSLTMARNPPDPTTPSVSPAPLALLIPPGPRDVLGLEELVDVQDLTNPRNPVDPRDLIGPLKLMGPQDPTGRRTLTVPGGSPARLPFQDGGHTTSVPVHRTRDDGDPIRCGRRGHRRHAVCVSSRIAWADGAELGSFRADHTLRARSLRVWPEQLGARAGPVGWAARFLRRERGDGRGGRVAEPECLIGRGLPRPVLRRHKRP